MTEIISAALTVIVALVVILITILIWVASSAVLPHIPNASLASSSPSVPASCSSQSRKYDVFLSFRGEDTRKTFVDHLYTALKNRLIHTYKDDETLLRGDTIGPSLLNAIEESQIAIIIFSENYANSSWCLDELTYIMKCREQRQQIVIPIFYHVDPSDVRKQKNKYKKAFNKHETDNNNKLELWRKALVAAGNIAGWEINHNINGYEAKCIKDIVDTILDRLLYLNSGVDENLVGMGARLQDLKSHLNIGSSGVSMVGIWGIGGGGKTTLASSLYNEISDKFDSCCFLGNIKEKSSKDGIESLQGKILSTILKTQVEIPSVDIGKGMIKKRLGRQSVLLVLDDIDDRKQLEALAGSHDWFGDGSRIIITTRNEQLLRAHRVNRVCSIILLSTSEAIRLFNKYAYNDDNRVENYVMLSQRVVSYAAGLPLALKVLGSFLYDKDNDEWISTLDRLKDIPEMEIVEKLRISVDGLKPIEKELFLDIACFFKKNVKHELMEMLEACGFHPVIGVKVLIQKALITINSDGEFDMHDLIEEMGHYIVRGEYPNNPEKHTRLWRIKEIKDMCFGNATMENNKTEAIICNNGPSSFVKLASKAKKLRLLSFVNEFDKRDIEGPNFLSNELRYMYWRWYPTSPFPESFQPRKLVVLKLEDSLQEELWRAYKSLPCLKELQLSSFPYLVRTPEFGGLPSLQKLTLWNCYKLEEIHPSLGNCTSLVYVCVKGCNFLRTFPTIVQMGKLEHLEIVSCNELHKFPEIEANMDSLVNLSLYFVGIESLPSTVGKYCTKLRSLKVEECSNLKSIEGNFHALKHLHKCEIRGFLKPIMLPTDLFNENICLEELHLYYTRQPSIPHLSSFVRRLTLSKCGLKDGEIPCDIGELSNLQELSLSYNEFSRLNVSLSQLTRLKLLNLDGCRKLVELPKLPSSIAILEADGCRSLEVVGDIVDTNSKWLCQVSVTGANIISGGEELLQSMLKGNAIENGCKILKLGGIKIPKGFISPLLSGNRYRLQLPENWYNLFSGFLMCAALKNYYKSSQYIGMKHEKGGLTAGMDSDQDMYWKESVDDEETWVGYVSFVSLKDTLWWDPTSTNVEFSFEDEEDEDESSCSGFGVGLVSETSDNVQIETTNSSSELSHDYTRYISIQQDSKSDLKCKLRF